MSFLNSAAGAAAGSANGMSTGLGHLIGADPSRISSIANSIGTGMNGIATAGGAAPGYAAPGVPQQPQQQQGVNNFMQLSDPDIMHAILAKFNIHPSAASTGYGR